MQIFQFPCFSSWRQWPYGAYVTWCDRCVMQCCISMTTSWSTAASAATAFTWSYPPWLNWATLSTWCKSESLIYSLNSKSVNIKLAKLSCAVFPKSRQHVCFVRRRIQMSDVGFVKIISIWCLSAQFGRRSMKSIREDCCEVFFLVARSI